MRLRRRIRRRRSDTPCTPGFSSCGRSRRSRRLRPASAGFLQKGHFTDRRARALRPSSPRSRRRGAPGSRAALSGSTSLLIEDLAAAVPCASSARHDIGLPPAHARAHGAPAGASSRTFMRMGRVPWPSGRASDATPSLGLGRDEGRLPGRGRSSSAGPAGRGPPPVRRARCTV